MAHVIPSLGFAAVVITMLALDLGASRRARGEPTAGSALAWSAAWLALAAAFGMSVTASLGASSGLEFFTAYFVEQALSIDNLFVMVLVFARFRVPRAAQRRLLTLGIAGVVVLRGLMIASGTALIEQIHALTYVLGGVLLVAAGKLARDLGPAEPAPEDDAPGASWIRSALGWLLPLTPELEGTRLTVVRAGVRYATPLLLALVTIEIADAVFALDSIPAVFGVTTDRFIAFTSNLFAVLGLRSMFFALSGLLDRVRYLKHGLVGVLAIVGLKMIGAAWWPTPPWLSLVLVTVTLGGAVVASLVAPTPTPDPEAARVESP